MKNTSFFLDPEKRPVVWARDEKNSSHRGNLVAIFAIIALPIGGAIIVFSSREQSVGLFSAALLVVLSLGLICYDIYCSYHLTSSERAQSLSQAAGMIPAQTITESGIVGEMMYGQAGWVRTESVTDGSVDLDASVYPIPRRSGNSVLVSRIYEGYKIVENSESRMRTAPIQ